MKHFLFVLLILIIQLTIKDCVFAHFHCFSEQDFSAPGCSTSTLSLLLLLLPSLGLVIKVLDSFGRRGHHTRRVLSRGILTIVEGDLLTLLDLPLCKKRQLRHVRIQVVNEHVEDVEVGVTTVVNKMGQVTIEGRVHGVHVVLPARVKVEVEQICPALGIVLLTPLLRLLIGDHLANVLYDEGARADPFQRFHAPAATIVRPEDGQFMFPPLLDNPIYAVRATRTPLVAFVNGRTNLDIRNKLCLENKSLNLQLSHL